MKVHNGESRVNYTTQGYGSPVVLIHGIGSSHHDWDALIPILAGSGYRALAPDLLGHGDSSKPDQAAEYHIQAVFSHLESWIQNLSLTEPLVLVGHSLGGYLSLAYAAHLPQQVRALVLIDPFYKIDQVSAFIRLLNRRPAIGERSLRLAPHWLVAACMALDPDALRWFSPASRRQIVLDLKRASPLFVHTLRSIPESPLDISKITAPTLVLWGENDLTLDPRYFPRLVNQLPDAKGLPIPHCGHQPHLSFPETVNRLVLEFLSSLV